MDGILLEILWSRLISIANQGAATLLRTSFSTVVGSAQDFKYMLADANGDSLATSDAGAVEFVVTFPRCLKAMLEAFPPEQLEAGDVLITNDPWLCAGHYNDIHVATPVFHRSSLVAFAGSVIHISDIGGRYASYDASEVFEEGLCLPILKLYRRGVASDDILKILMANVRAPDMQLGDIRAMVTGNEVGARLLVEFLEEYELEDLTEISEAIQSRVEHAIRAAISDLPDGSYEHETWVDGYDLDVRIKSTITIDGDELEVDYTGSSPQTTRASINCVLNLTQTTTLHPLKAILAPHIPANEGAIRPIRVTAEPGSILNARRPSPVRSRSMVSLLVPDHLLGAMAQICPERVTAEMGTRWFLMGDRAPQDGKRVIASFFQAGAMGAAQHRDGPSAKFFPIMASHTPVELFERSTNLLVVEKNLRPDSGGPGQFRGGCGQHIRIENHDETPVVFTFWRPRVRHPAQGLFGGRPGAPGRPTLNGHPIEAGRFSLELGSTAELLTPGGGGYGDPLTRDTRRVINDVNEGYVSVERAAEDYGLIVDQVTKSATPTALRENNTLA